MRRLPPLNALRAFEAASRHRSFTAAAGELGVSHAAIGRHVRSLEATLGLSLFRRDGRGVALTEPGARLAAVATDALDRIAEGAAALAEEAGAGLLRISVEPAFAARWLVPNLGGFRRRHPRIDIELDPTARLADLRHDPVDLAIRYGRGPWPGTATDPLVRVFAFPVCSPDLVAGGPPLAEPDDLRHYTLLHEETTRWWANWLVLAGATLVDSARGPRFRDTSLALEAAIAGQGVALGDTVLAAGDLASGRLIRPLAVEEPCETYHLVMAEGRRLTPAAGAFRAWLLDAMAPFAG